MGTVHMVYGPVGSGKTTFGRKFAAERKAAFFCLDEWIATLFMMDAPSPITLDWAIPRTQRCEQQIWNVARQLLALGITSSSSLASSHATSVRALALSH